MKIKLIYLGLVGLLTMSCAQTKQAVLEVTKFRLKTTATASIFNQLDAEVEEKFTSKQPGFIKRQSAVNESGEYVVLVYWNSNEEADASMQKFMKDRSVKDYASMIEGASMNMSRYTVDQTFGEASSSFIEVMSYSTNEGTDSQAFKKLNKKVGKVVTAPKEGFVQRIIGMDEQGTQVVAVYWDNKANSDAALQPFMEHELSQKFMGMMNQESIQFGRYQTLNTADTKLTNKDKVVALLNSFNTGDQTPISYINPEKYIQHNLAVSDGLAGFGEVMKHEPPQGFKANVVRAFQDGDFVFTHTEYDFFGPKAAFDVFRFEDGLIVEHWDNLTPIAPANPSGRTQLDGATSLEDPEKTEENKALVNGFIDAILFKGQMDKITSYVNPEKYLQHNTAVADGLDGLNAAFEYFAANDMVMVYDKTHMVLGQGNFVLAVSEGKFGKAPGDKVSFYDLFRIEDGLIVEHWDVIEAIPPQKEWKNKNGKF